MYEIDSILFVDLPKFEINQKNKIAEEVKNKTVWNSLQRIHKILFPVKVKQPKEFDWSRLKVPDTDFEYSIFT